MVASGGPTAPANNLVKANILLRNAPDLFWDGTGTGNVFTANLYKTKNF